jgi:hypothetical protein
VHHFAGRHSIHWLAASGGTDELWLTRVVPLPTEHRLGMVRRSKVTAMVMCAVDGAGAHPFVDVGVRPSVHAIVPVVLEPIGAAQGGRPGTDVGGRPVSRHRDGLGRRRPDHPSMDTARPSGLGSRVTGRNPAHPASPNDGRSVRSATVPDTAGRLGGLLPCLVPPTWRPCVWIICAHCHRAETC